MKKKIIIGLTIFSLVFLLGGIYIITTIESSTSTLDNLIKLHQVEILREHLLIQIKRVQSDLNLKNTRFARSIDTVIINVKNMESMADTCFECHHSAEMTNRLKDLKSQVKEYKNLLSRVFTISANTSRLEAEENNAFEIGEQLITKVNSMITMATLTLENKTQSSLREIARTKTILYMLIAIIPLLAAGLGFIYIRGFTRPVTVLLKATRRLESGDLDYRIDGLKDEFGEVATSFNEMSNSLKQYMHTIEESEKRYRMLFESAGDAIFILESEGENAGKIVSANHAAAEMHGYTVNELLELNMIKDLDTAEASEGAPDRIKRILNGEWIKDEITHRKKDGTSFHVEISAGLFEFMNNKYILAFDRDITERKKMENQILQSKIDWEDTFNTITDMITIHDSNYSIVRSNKAAEKILGLPFIEITEAKCFAYYHGKDRPPEDCPSCECYKTGKPATFELFEPHLKRFLEIRAMPRFDMNNQLTGLIHIVRDITERKNIEDTLKRAAQMKMVGEWAAGLVHEIKNSLTGIKTSVELLKEEPNIAEEDKSNVFMAVDEIKRIELLLKSLLNFARPPKLQLFATNVNELLDNAIEFSLMQPSLSPNNTGKIHIVKKFNKHLPQTMTDQLQLRQVFVNMLLNANDAMHNEGEIIVSTFYDDEMDTINIEIADTGKGIDKKIANKIFKPFFTTKSKGSGLGLAITKRIIDQHRGEICFENKPDGGTIFYIALPVIPVEKEQLT